MPSTTTESSVVRHRVHINDLLAHLGLKSSSEIISFVGGEGGLDQSGAWDALVASNRIPFKMFAGAQIEGCEEDKQSLMRIQLEVEQYGCIKSAFLKSMSEELTMRLSGPHMCAMSMLSDAQECLSMNALKRYRHTVAQARLIVEHFIPGPLVEEFSSLAAEPGQLDTEHARADYNERINTVKRSIIAIAPQREERRRPGPR